MTSVTTPEARSWATRRRPKHGTTTRILIYILLWGYAVVSMAPLVFMLIGSLRTNAAITTNPVGFEFPPTLASYVDAWQNSGFSEYFFNSAIVTVSSVLLTAVVSTPAAYALSRGKSKLFGTIESIFVAGLMLPVQLAILPLFYLLDTMHMIDTAVALILVYGAVGVPFSIFVLTSFFRQVPLDVDEAAQIDGAGPLQRFWSVMVPMVRPAIATVIVFRFVPTWNDFIYPLVLLRSKEHYTLPVGLSNFFGEFQTNYAALFAALTIATIPLLLLFLLATKEIVAGLTAGMSK